MATSISYSENHLDPTKRVPESSPLVISDDGNFANLYRISHNEKKYYNSPDFMFPLVAIFTLLVFVESYRIQKGQLVVMSVCGKCPMPQG